MIGGTVLLTGLIHIHTKATDTAALGSGPLKHAAVREEEALFTHLNSKHFIQTNTSVFTSDPKRFAHFLPFTEISHPHWLLLQHEATEGLSHCVSTSTQARSQGNV